VEIEARGEHGIGFCKSMWGTTRFVPAIVESRQAIV
jgi:hypothetical protein